jgi:DNA-binding response OmpR family regulator
MKDGKYEILCVDDDADFLDSVTMIVEDAGFAVRTAPSAEDGLRAYKAARPDCMLVDLMMEEVDAGINLVKEIKVLGNPPPIYMLSSVGDNLNINVDYSQLGLSGVLQKPVNPSVLIATLKSKLT